MKIQDSGEDGERGYEKIQNIWRFHMLPCHSHQARFIYSENQRSKKELCKTQPHPDQAQFSNYFEVLTLTTHKSAIITLWYWLTSIFIFLESTCWKAFFTCLRKIFTLINGQISWVRTQIKIRPRSCQDLLRHVFTCVSTTPTHMEN